MLAAARLAYHRLQTGSLKETVRYGDTTVTYTAANREELRRYIGELAQQVEDGGSRLRGEPFQVEW